MAKPLKIHIGLIHAPGDPALSPEILAHANSALESYAKFLNEDHSELERQYRKGLISDSPSYDWYSAMSLKDENSS